MAKKKRSSSKKKSNKLLYIVLWFLLLIIVSLAVFIAGYYYGHEYGFDSPKGEVKKVQKAPEIKELHKVEDKNITILQQEKKEEPQEQPKEQNASLIMESSSKKGHIKENELKEKLKEVLKKDIKQEEHKPKSKKESAEYSNASHEYEGEIVLQTYKREKLTGVVKPKLAIIIDDVCTKSQVNAIKSLNLPLTMSFLPPSKERPSSNSLADEESFYMVHLPMEAQSFTKEEPYTLKVGDSKETIAQRIGEIKRLFPRVKYINNHTGSKFTSNEEAVERLILALQEQSINFIDSRTIGSSKVPNVMKKYQKKYVARDVFLDHKQEKEYIKAQIRKAIDVAKEHGSAVAIGHPHSNTILAIYESKKYFRDIDLVLVDKLY